jgi:hypothetical protein
MNSLSLAISNNSLNSASSGSKKNSDSSIYQLHQTPTNKSFGTTKTGYLLKHSLRNRMRKHWLKRKCAIENGLFLIYHSDVCLKCYIIVKYFILLFFFNFQETKDPVCLNLITCQVKIIENKRFKVFSGSSKL